MSAAFSRRALSSRPASRLPVCEWAAPPGREAPLLENFCRTVDSCMHPSFPASIREFPQHFRGNAGVCRARPGRRAPRSSSREQSSPLHEHVGQRRHYLEPMQVLRQASVAGLLETEHALDHADHVLNLGAHLRLRPVLRLHDLVDPATREPVLAVREVPRVRGVAAALMTSRLP
jgi:hypothetical protein